MKRKIALISLGIAGLVMGSCVRDGVKSDYYDSSTSFSFSYSVDGMNMENKTRANVVASPDEQKVNNIHLFFFEPKSDKSGELAACITVDQNLTMDQNITLTNTGLQVANAYNVIAIANITDNLYISGSVSDWIAEWENSTEREFSEGVLANISFPGSGIPSDWIPMSGYMQKEENIGKIDVNLTRVVARLDLLNNADDYELMSVSVWNAYYNSSLTGEAVLDYSKKNGLRTQWFYNAPEIEVDDDDVGRYVEGQLYVFENQVVAPENGDRHTTCLIVGLQKIGTNLIEYYRINIHPEGSSQNLKRNNAYIVNISAVGGSGYSTEPEAYVGTTTQLHYTINYWDLDDNGLIVADMYSVLAIPAKTVKIGKEGVTNAYTITTFTTLQNPAPLMIKSQIYDPGDGKISATLSGNTLYVTAEDMGDLDPERSGIITLSFADLEASINVLQSGSVDQFLTITLDEEFTNSLAASANASTENITVTASGAWTAKLYDGNTGQPFSLKSDTRVEEIKSTEQLSNRFRIHVLSANDTSEERPAFVLVSLDEDPLNYVSVLAVTQRVAADIEITPNIRRMEFDGMGAVTFPNSGINTISVSTASAYALTVPTLTDDTHFNLSTDLDGTTTSGTITITPKATNSSGGAYSTSLIITNGAGGGSETITITQNTMDMWFNPIAISGTVSPVGGKTAYVSVNTGDASSKWSAVITTSGSKKIFNHKAYIELEDGSQSGLSVDNVSVDTRFRVVFPKIYYPNRENNITATVWVTIDGSTLSKEITATQSQLASKGVKLWSSNSGRNGAIYPSVGSSNYGAHNSYFFTYMNSLSGTNNYTQASGTGVQYNRPTEFVEYTMVNISNQTIDVTGLGYVSSFMNAVDGLTVFASNYNGSSNLNPLNNASSPLKLAGYTVAAGPSTSYNVTQANSSYVNTGVSDSRIYKILITEARLPISSTDIRLYKYGTNTTVTSRPSTGIPIVLNHSGTPVMVVDPGNRLIYQGDVRMFRYNTGTNMTADGETFMKNYVEYECISAMYGSHFMDMLIDYDDPSDPDYIPAPWDSVWGDNAWPN